MYAQPGMPIYDCLLVGGRVGGYARHTDPNTYVRTTTDHGQTFAQPHKRSKKQGVPTLFPPRKMEKKWNANAHKAHTAETDYYVVIAT